MFCSHCGKGDQPVDTYCKGCGKYLYNPSLWRRRNTPPGVISWMLLFNSLCILACVMVAPLILWPWHLSIRLSLIFLGDAVATQILNILFGIHLRKRLTRNRKELAEKSAQKSIEDS